MKQAKFLIFPLLLLVLTSTIVYADNPWGSPANALPNWVSDDAEFTMSVALADLDNDYDLDLIAGNYDYPYDDFTSETPSDLGLSKIGAYLVGYQFDPGTPSDGFDTHVNLTQKKRCIDCIAVADYDNDGDMDIAMGLVVGKGKDGGVVVLENLYQSGVSYENLSVLFDDTESSYYLWYSADPGQYGEEGSYDCHTVRWVDFNNDGFLDLAALEVPGILHLYKNVPNLSTPGTADFTWSKTIDFTNHPAFRDLAPKDEYSDDFVDEDIPIVCNGITMEFGDLNSDGLLDMFLAGGDIPLVVKNMGEAGGYYTTDPANCWEGDRNNPPDDLSCASFGFYHDDPVGLIPVLIVGSREWRGDPLHDGKSGSVIYKLNEYETEIVEYQRQDVYGTTSAQSVSDIQWAYFDEDENDYMDVVATSYPIYEKELISPFDEGWDRGYEVVHLNPEDYPITPPVSYYGTSNWSETSDLSTSLALGDINYGSTAIRTDSFDDLTHNLFYLSRFPFISLVEIRFNGTSHVWVPGMETPPANVCYDPLNGWISIDDLPSGTTSIEIDYYYGDELDLAVGNDGYNVVYFYDYTGDETYAVPTPDLDMLPPYSNPGNHVYQAEPMDGGTSLMAANDPVGFSFFACWGDYDYPSNLQEWIDVMPSARRIALNPLWRNLEIFKGHYFWDFQDKNLDTIYQNRDLDHKYEAHLHIWESPVWTKGNWTITEDPLLEDDWNRPSDERLHTMFMRNLVNRYRPGGVLNDAESYDWSDWGVKVYQCVTEPSNFNQTMMEYGTTASDVLALGTKLYHQYQLIKEIESEQTGDYPELVVVSPNFMNNMFDVPYEANPNPKYLGPRMPWLNDLNDALDGAGVVQFGGPTEVLWNYVDWISLQVHCREDAGIGAHLEEELKDGLTTITPSGLPGDTRWIGRENYLWGYYKEGLGNYYGGTENWYPVMKDPDAPHDLHPHPFYIWDWHDEWDFPSSIPHDDWLATAIAELFGTDFVPNDNSNNWRLVKYVMPFFGDYPFDQIDDPISQQRIAVIEQCAKLFNKPPAPLPALPDTSVYYLKEYSQDEPITDQPLVHRYTFKNATNDEYIHFMRTSTNTEFGADEFVEVTGPGNTWSFDLWNTAYTGGEKIDCYSAMGQQWQKDVSATGGAHIEFASGEMGPAMLIIQEEDTPSPQTNYTQSLSLHKGWNLVSWHIDLDPTGQWFPQTFPDIFQYQPWFGEDEELYQWFDDDIGYPTTLFSQPYHQWLYRQAYYLKLVDGSSWQYTDRPQFTLTGSGFTETPSNAWDEAEQGQWQTPEDERFGENWYFISYPVPGYTKLATVYNNTPPDPPSGDDISYKGPFHWLIWNESNPSQHLSQVQDAQFLTIVKTDDGRHYIPYLPGFNPREIDEIGVLEPGRGYFLGFYRSDDFSFQGWEDYPGWPTQGADPDPKGTQNQIASSSHFQFKKCTHWSYPVVIDTLALEGVELENGDEFGIFTSYGLCVGGRRYEGEFPLVITTWKDDKATPDVVDGYTEGDEMVIKLFDASENEEIMIDLGPQIMAEEENTVAPSHSGFGRGSFALKSLTHGIQSVTQLPQEFRTGQNYPNPFNSSTVIPLELPQRSRVTIDLFDICGRLVWTHWAGVQNAGWPKVHFNASNLASGVYFYRTTVEGMERGGTYHSVGKMLLLK